MSDDLQRLQGVWTVSSLEMDARKVPAAMLAEARIEVSGDRFSSTGMGAPYEGTLQLKPEAKPRQLDMMFTSGPEKGNTNLCIYDLKGEVWKLCIATRGSERPAKFAAPVGSGIAVETLRRAAAGQAATPAARAASADASGGGGSATEIEGDWAMVSLVQDGKPLDPSMVKWVSRTMHRSRTTVTAGPNTMLNAEFTCDPAANPKTIDYTLLAGANKGQKQLGIYELDGDVLSICMAAPGKGRPTEYSSSNGDGATYSVWRRK